MPLRDRSGQRWPPAGMPHVVAATEVCSRFIGTCRELGPPLPLPSSFLSLLYGVFLNAILRITPFFLWCVPGRLFVAGSTCLFLFSPLPFSPSLFLSFSLSSLHPLPWVSLDIRHGWEPFLFGVSLDACVVAGNTCFLLSLLLFSSSPPPSFLARGVFTSKLGFCNRFFK